MSTMLHNEHNVALEYLKFCKILAQRLAELQTKKCSQVKGKNLNFKLWMFWLLFAKKR